MLETSSYWKKIPSLESDTFFLATVSSLAFANLAIFWLNFLCSPSLMNKSSPLPIISHYFLLIFFFFIIFFECCLLKRWREEMWFQLALHAVFSNQRFTLRKKSSEKQINLFLLSAPFSIMRQNAESSDRVIRTFKSN